MIGLLEASAMTGMQSVLSVVFGGLVGLLLGLVGGGGSILTVPILVYVIGLDVQAATATSLAIVGASALAGAIPHARAGRVNVHVAVFFGLFGVVGAFAGTWLNQRVAGPVILLTFGLLMLAVAARMWSRRPVTATGGATTDQGKTLNWKIPLAGLLVGLLTGFFGVGGGFLIVPALALALGLPMAAAVGTSLAIIAINAVSGLAAHAGTLELDVAVAALFIAGGLAGGLIGGRFAGHVDEKLLARGFALLVSLIGAYLVAQNWLALTTIGAS